MRRLSASDRPSIGRTAMVLKNIAPTALSDASFCVDSTIREAYARDFDVIVPGDAISDTEIEATQAVLRSTERFHGFVTTTDDLVTALRAQVLTTTAAEG